MNKPRYYSGEAQILSAIDRTQRNVRVRRRAARIWWGIHKRLVLEGGPEGGGFRHQITIARNNAEHYDRLALQIETTTLRKLKNKLAEFRTAPLAGVGLEQARVK